MLLAAGEASRFGSPKQLAAVEGEALVRRSARAIIDAGVPLTVVTGAHADEVARALQGLQLTRLHNPDWADGIGGSIGLAFGHLRADAAVDAGLVGLADQPLVGAAQLQRLIDAHRQHPDGITAADHGPVPGPPCVFARRYFDALAQLRGPRGARALIAAQRAALQRVAMPEAATDIDTPEQYRALLDAQRN